MLTDAHVTLAVAGTAAYAKNLELARSAAPDLREVFVLEDGGLDAIVERGTDADRARVREVAGGVKAADLATLIYTSGTTGRPKGCVLAHSNWLWVAKQGGVTLKQMVGDDDSTLLFLPLAHSFARMVQFLCLQADVQIGYARSIDTLGEDLASFQPTFLLAVPRVFEKVFNAAQKQGHRREGQGLRRSRSPRATSGAGPTGRRCSPRSSTRSPTSWSTASCGTRSAAGCATRVGRRAAGAAPRGASSTPRASRSWRATA